VSDGARAGGRKVTMMEWREMFEEDAGYLEYCCGMSREAAELEAGHRSRERRAARASGNIPLDPSSKGGFPEGDLRSPEGLGRETGPIGGRG
jgi:hypothetical protein